MPPKIKAKPPAKVSNSKDLISLGPRHISDTRRAKRDADGNVKERPTTTRALILRNGKHGARGTGELVSVSRITGREKLDLLAGACPIPQHCECFQLFALHRGHDE